MQKSTFLMLLALIGFFVVFSEPAQKYMSCQVQIWDVKNLIGNFDGSYEIVDLDTDNGSGELLAVIIEYEGVSSIFVYDNGELIYQLSAYAEYIVIEVVEFDQSIHFFELAGDRVIEWRYGLSDSDGGISRPGFVANGISEEDEVAADEFRQLTWNC